MSKVILLPDTNVFLHFPALHDVDWCGISGAESVIITIAPAITRELNTHKDNPRSRRLRDRADAALKELHARYKRQKPRQLRPNVEIQFLDKSPVIDFAQYGLVKELPDDWLIAAAIELASRSQDQVAIVTADMGLEVKAASHVRVIEMPESLRLPAELNSDEKRIKDLESQLRAVQAASPKLKLAFQDGSLFQVLTLFDFPNSDDKMIAFQLEQARKKYPKSKESPNRKSASITFSSSPNTHLFRPYNEQVDQYIAELEPYFKRLNKIANWYNRTAQVKLLIQNEGGAPGNDIDISIHFPDGFEVVDENGLPDMPTEPRPPRSPDEIMKSLATMSTINPADDFQYSMPKGLGNVQLLDIKKTNSHEVKFYVRTLKHHGHIPLPDLYLHFSEEPKSFKAEYRIIAGNVPTPLAGALSFVSKDTKR